MEWILTAPHRRKIPSLSPLHRQANGPLASVCSSPSRVLNCPTSNLMETREPPGKSRILFFVCILKSYFILILLIINFIDFYSMAMCIFHDHADESFVVVGTGKDMMLAPRASTSGFLYVYRFNNGGKGVELLHKTPIEDTPTALCSFQGRLLVGMGKTLRIYDLGKRKLLRKCENKVRVIVRFGVNETRGEMNDLSSFCRISPTSLCRCTPKETELWWLTSRNHSILSSTSTRTTS